MEGGQGERCEAHNRFHPSLPLYVAIGATRYGILNHWAGERQYDFTWLILYSRGLDTVEWSCDGAMPLANTTVVCA